MEEAQRKMDAQKEAVANKFSFFIFFDTHEHSDGGSAAENGCTERGCHDPA